jgi:hypothetical protein
MSTASPAAARTPDPDRLGTYNWALRTQGRMGRRERANALAHVAMLNLRTVRGFAQLARGRRAPGAAAIDVDMFVPPDSRLARAAEEACAEQSPGIAAHSYRTWVFGHALAQLDGFALDPELFYCAALIHDWGIGSITPGQDFTIRGAQRAIRCAHDAGLSEETGLILADAITIASNPSMDPAVDGIGAYIAVGAMVDGGLRLWDLSPQNVDRVLAKYPRGKGFKRELAGLIRAEARATRGSRFSLYARCGMPLLIMAAPYRDS